MDLDLGLDSILFMGWVGFQICEILWIRFWGWIHFRPQIGSDYGFVFLLGFGLIFFLNSESESVNPNPTTSNTYKRIIFYHQRLILQKKSLTEPPEIVQRRKLNSKV